MTICLCTNCGNPTPYAIEPKVCPRFCKDCSTAEKRAENKRINEEISAQAKQKENTQEN